MPKNDHTYVPKGSWRTLPCESNNTHADLVMVTLREDVEQFRKNPRFNIRIEVSWKYGEKGMPDTSDAQLMGQVTDRLAECFDKDPVAVLTGIYTGDGRRDWVFYTLSLGIFGRKFNEALADLPVIPLEFDAESDPEWEEYDRTFSI